ncbi:MAG: molybdenum ABC transporter ATP-binding protein [Gammaproteobacteria bacterium]|nr:molybdenum ABC transporter ATP-binding protein [Gammaproteobacteria bacterium]
MSILDVNLRLSHENFILDANFSVPATGITGILGASGSGKTSLLRAIAGLESAAEGHVKIAGETWQDVSVCLPAHRRRVGFVPQQPCLFPHLNVQQNIQFATDYRNTDGFSLAEATELLGISDVLMRKPNSLSGGEQQRVAIARALASVPHLLLFDEPLSALDEERKSELLPYLERLHRELDIPGLYVSHALAEVACIADNLVSLDNGKVMACGTVSEMLSGLVGGNHLSNIEHAMAVIDTQVMKIDTNYQLAHLGFAGGEMLVTAAGLSIDDVIRIQVQARDVSISLSHVADSSILNVLPAVIDKVMDDGQAHVVLRLRVGEQFLLSRISRKSFKLLNLASELEVFAQIKSVALLA